MSTSKISGLNGEELRWLEEQRQERQEDREQRLVGLVTEQQAALEEWALSGEENQEAWADYQSWTKSIRELLAEMRRFRFEPPVQVCGVYLDLFEMEADIES